MSQHVDYASITSGMPVFDAMGVSLGPVEAIDTVALRVQGQNVPVDQIARVDATGVHLHLASATNITTRADANRAEDGRMVIPLVEERLTVATRETDLGEIILRKRVIEEERMIPVVFRREEVQVVRREPGQPLPPEALSTDGAEVTRIPINAWEPVISKQAFVSREVVVDKGHVAEERHVTGTVRRQQVSVEARYADAREELERHFITGQSATGGGIGPQTFADVEPHYRVGFVAGSEPQHGDRDFAAIEPQIRETYGADADQNGDGWAQLRDQIQAGFEAARRRN